ncbi:ribosome biogenesis GTPase Der [bacterium]|nr:ribosome biogenesis GTPase Der [candidate division CSSED10-310 bacterium]
MKELRVSIIGRVNVGKSTLFNRLTRTRDAIVENTPGVTRDRKEGRLTISNRRIVLVDTGGIDAEVAADSKPADEAQKQSLREIDNADVLLFLVDGRSGLLPGDLEIADKLRRTGRLVLLVVNKMESEYAGSENHEFFRLGLGDPIPISSEHNVNIDTLIRALAELMNIRDLEPDAETAVDDSEICIAVVGRPNVGKSSFLNSLIGEDRHIVTDVPGTTRDSVDSIIRVNEQTYRLIDTAGLRRIGKTTRKLDKISAIMSRRSIQRSHVTLLLLDAAEGVTAQDLKIASYIIDEGKACIIIGNKWDLTDRTTERFKILQQEIRDHYVSMPWAPFMVMSALESHNTLKVFSLIDRIMKSTEQPVATAKLNKVLHDAQIIHPPPRRDSRHPLKFYYCAQIANRPPTFLLFTNTRTEIHFSYRRFLSNQIRDAFGFEGWPIRLVFRHRHDDRGRRWD